MHNLFGSIQSTKVRRLKFYTMLRFTMLIQNIFTGLYAFTPGSLPKHFFVKVKENLSDCPMHSKKVILPMKSLSKPI